MTWEFTLTGLLIGILVGLTGMGGGSLRVPEQSLRLGLASVLVLSGVKLVNAPGADWIVLGGFVVGGIVFTVWGFHELRGRRRAERRKLATDLPLP